MRAPTVLLAAAAIAAAGPACGDDQQDRLALRTPPQRSSADPLPEIARAGKRAERAARFFTVPAVVSQGDVLTLRTSAAVKAFNAGFPCGARLLHVQEEGRFLIGTFELTRRPAHECSARGELLRVAFAVRKGKIAEWREVPQAAVPGAARPEPPPRESA